MYSDLVNAKGFCIIAKFLKLTHNFMKYFVTFVTFLFLVFSCSQANKTSSIAEEKKVLEDSITNLLDSYLISKNSILLDKAMWFSNLILEKDSSMIDDLRFNTLKVQILTYMGKNKEAFYLKGKTIPNDINNVDRLSYNGLKKLIENQQDSARFYFSLATTIYNDKLVKNPGDLDAFIGNLGIHIYLNEKEKAEKGIDNKIKQFPDNQLLKDLKGNLDNMIEQAHKFLSEISQ